MMSTKLTLTINELVIKKAKKYAKSKESSLSNIIENYLKVLVAENQSSTEEITPIVKSLRGAFTTDTDLDYKEELKKALAEKYK